MKRFVGLSKTPTRSSSPLGPALPNGLVIKVQAAADAPFTVMFEPTGMSYDLAGGESMTAVVENAADNAIEIFNWNGGISIVPPGNVTTYDAAGNELNFLN
ncbi:hypothetical protein [Dactylosporangium sp. CS-033363]|uniref:hypothetical protein n=1 Tax=Dactylosporangium sp. CS-033363 TaxID=3239935 RepID=UPI003D901B7C